MKINRNVFTIILLFLFITMLKPAVWALTDTKFIEVELRYDGTYVFVPVTVGEKDLMFILDTAAGGSVISPATRNDIGYTEKDGQISEIVGAGGTTNYQSLKIPRISFGGLTQTDFNVTVIDLRKFQKKDGGEPYAGILGNDFLRYFDVEINLPASNLRLYPHDKNGKTVISGLKKLTGIANQGMAEGFVAFEALIEEKPVFAVLDSGAPATILNWAAARAANVTPETKGIIRREQGTGGLGTQKAETFLHNFKNIRAGNAIFSAAELRIADLPIFKTLGLSEKPSMIFGLDMLKRQAVFISYSTKNIYFYTSPASAKD